MFLKFINSLLVSILLLAPSQTAEKNSEPCNMQMSNHVLVHTNYVNSLCEELITPMPSNKEALLNAWRKKIEVANILKGITSKEFFTLINATVIDRRGTPISVNVLVNRGMIEGITEMPNVYWNTELQQELEKLGEGQVQKIFRDYLNSFKETERLEARSRLKVIKEAYDFLIPRAIAGGGRNRIIYIGQGLAEGDAKFQLLK